MIVYTANIGGFDEPRSDIAVFTDSLGLPPRIANRLYKCCPHLWFPGQETTYVDANIFVKGTLSDLHDLLRESEMVAFEHPYRKTISEERVSIAHAYDTAQLAHDYPEHMDKPTLCECGILIRGDTPRIRRLGETWFSLICRYCERDQVTFPIALSIVPELKFKTIPGNLREHPLFIYKPR